MFSYILPWIVYGLVAICILGSGFFMMIHMSIKQGFRKALAFVIGSNLVDPIIAVISYYTMHRFLQGDVPINIGAAWHVAASISIIMGIFMIINKVSITATASHIHQSLWYIYAFAKWFIVQASNIFSWIVGMCVASYFVLHQDPAWFVCFVGTVFTIVLIADILKAYYAEKISRRVSPQVLKNIQRTMGVIVIAIGVILWYRTDICAHDTVACFKGTQDQLQQLFDKQDKPQDTTNPSI